MTAMTTRQLLIGLTAAVLVSLPAWSQAADDEAGFVSLFDGKTLDGWDGSRLILRR